jgi:hypothetical protein
LCMLKLLALVQGPIETTMKELSVLLISLLLISGVQAATIRIPDDQPTIQDGVTNAVSFDTVLVAPGTYRENIDFAGKSICLMSGAGPMVTVLKPDSTRLPIVNCTSGETPDAKIIGFAFEGTTGQNAAIRVEASSPTIIGNHFRDHHNLTASPILYLRDGSQSLVRNNLFYRNEDADRIVWIDTDLPVQFIGNTIHSGGSAMLIFAPYAVVRNCIVTGCNRGIYAYFGVVEDHNCVWGNALNYASIEADPTDISVDPQFVDVAAENFNLQQTSACIDAGHTSFIYDDPDGTVSDIGALYFDQRVPRATNLNLGAEDISHVLDHSPTLYWGYYDTLGTHESFEVQVGTDDDWSVAEMWASGEVASSDTSTVYAGSALQNGDTYWYRARVKNSDGWGNWEESVFRMNTPPGAPQPNWPSDQVLVSRYGVQLYVDNSSDTEGDSRTYDFEFYSDVGLTVLVDSVQGVVEGEAVTSSGKFAAVPAGSEYWWRARAHDGFEPSAWSTVSSFISREPVVLHVSAGSSTIQSAIDSVQERDTILVAAGTYSGAGNVDLTFTGTNCVMLSEDGPDVTIIECAGSETSRHFGLKFTGGEDTTTIVNGFTIQNGYWLPGEDGEGAAVYCNGASPTLRNLKITSNVGYGLLVARATPIVDSCEITANSYTGINIYGIGWSADTTEMRVAWTLAADNGGEGLYVDGGALRVTNCSFINNARSGLMLGGEPPVATVSTAKGNADAETIIENSLAAYNGEWGFGQMFWYPGGFVFYCSDAYGNTMENWFLDTTANGGYGNISEPPLFCDTAGAVYSISSGSACAPANNSCGVLMGAFDVGCECCEGRTGNVDNDPDELVDIGDLTALIAYLYIPPNPRPACIDEANTDGDVDRLVDIGDLTALVAYLYIPPNPETAPCP